MEGVIYMTQENFVNIGFDIGIASVGWSVVDTQNGNIIETGVSIFKEATADENVTRRDARQGRRLLRRRKVRVRDMRKYLHTRGFDCSNGNLDCYALRVKGLTEQLTKEELTACLCQIAKHRGISYDLKDAEDTESNVQDYKAGIAINQKLLNTQTPGQIQYERLQKYGKVRGKVEVVIDGKEQTLLNVFPNSAYQAEVEQILTKQSEFYPEITPKFKEDILEIIGRKRDYFAGPGSKNWRTDYGIYRTDGKNLKNLFSILIGKDKIYPEEYRAAGSSYTAQLFNVLNDLNNLRISSTPDGKITCAQKEEIVNYLLATTKKQESMINVVAKITGSTKDTISGYRKDKNDRPEIHSMAIYRKIHRDFLELGIDVTTWPVALWDKLGEILTLNTENGEIRRSLITESKEFEQLTPEVCEHIIANKQSFKSTSNNKWHRFSLKTMNQLIPDMYKTNKEQMTLLTELGLLKEGQNYYDGKDKIDIKHITDELYNPVVRKSVMQTMQVFNELWKKYSNIQSVVIEMARDKNSKEERENIEKFQKSNAKEKDAALLAFCTEIGESEEIVLNKILKDRSKKLPLMIRLWYQQEEKCPYSGKIINAVDILNSPGIFEIDHIIPLSISLDDGMNNKVLCYADMNQIKGQKTPYMFMNEGQGQGFDKLIAQVKSNKQLPKAKKDNLLNTDDINDPEVQRGFVARNLVDTRYSSRVVLNELQNFIKAQADNTKVVVVRGKLTHKLREVWNINKSRDTHYHHAVDASLIAMIPLLNLWKKRSLFAKKVGEQLVDIETGEILSSQEYKKALYESPIVENYKEQLRGIEDKIKFHHQVDKKSNRKVSDATIYGTRKVTLAKDKKATDYVWSKINIYTVDGYKKFIDICQKDKTKFMMYRIDPKTFGKLEQIVAEYPDKIEEQQANGRIKLQEISPFEVYRREHGKVRKYAKKDNGPEITTLKYYDSKLISCIDISSKYQLTGDKRVALQSLKPWRTDVYYDHMTQEYQIMGLKYSDLQYIGKDYGITKDKYQVIKDKEGISEDAEFMFTLYRNDRIKVIDTQNNQSVELLFGSRTTSNKGYVELKPLDRSKFNGKEVVDFYGAVTPNGQFVKKLARKGYIVYKVNTDPLGNPFYIKKEGEKPKNIIDKN